MKKLLILGTGGTIAGTASSAQDHTGYTAAQIGVQDLLSGVPGLAHLLGDAPVACEQLAQIDSKDMQWLVMARLALHCAQALQDDAVLGVVVTHGTDTLEETAYFLQLCLAHLLKAHAKPIVLTCAMRPATSSEADGPGNLRDAVAVAVSAAARGRGVLCVCAGEIHHASLVQKVHTSALNAFSSQGARSLGHAIGGGSVHALDEAEHGSDGLLGQVLHSLPEPDYAEVVFQPLENTIFIENLSNVSAKWSYAAIEKLAHLKQWPRVEILHNHAQADGLIVKALLSQMAQTGIASLRGIVVAGTGNGTLGTDLEAALLQAADCGVRVWRVSRCAFGAVVPTPHDVLPSVAGLGAAKARVAMVLQLLQVSGASDVGHH